MGNNVRRTLVLIFGVSLVLLSGCGDANLKKARRFQEAKDYEQAIHYYKLALDKNPDNQTARYGLIESYALSVTSLPPEEVTPEKVEEAMEEMKPIAQPLKDDVNIRRYMSLIYQMLAKRYAEVGRDDKALEAWTEVTKLDPSYSEAYFNLGIAVAKTGRVEESLPHFQKAVDLNPYFIKGYYAMGRALLSLNRTDEAIKQFTRALELNPEDPMIRHDLGLAYSQAGDNKKAIEQYLKALEVEPRFSVVYKSLAEAYKAIGDTKKAQEAEQKWNEYVEALKEAQKGQMNEPQSGGDSLD
ncbi:MAG: tetratricopeptide repeat protein [Candidatus Abyssobacteria bacterium SURF_17]|uniref:Tetratricopeptide repeat protein n=1 Tax=Candidatus Abyssobacteria bacterium SURF_17 TaxID=2093361 RepID=A0A419EN34_9BACT|nr:MAG: tetratricopeptide repeat protein [Candidatus Abyssubacteria bacterium SURF_17]